MSFEVLAAPPGVRNGAKVRKGNDYSDQSKEYRRTHFDDIDDHILQKIVGNLNCPERLRLCATNKAFKHLCVTDEHHRDCEENREYIFGTRDPPEETTFTHDDVDDEDGVVETRGITTDVIKFVHDPSHSIDKAIEYYLINFEDAIYKLRRDYHASDLGHENNISILFMLEVHRRPYLWKMIPGLFMRMFLETYDLLTKHSVIDAFALLFRDLDLENLRSLVKDQNRNPMGLILVSSAIKKAVQVYDYYDSIFFLIWTPSYWTVDDDCVTLVWTYKQINEGQTHLIIKFALNDDHSFKTLKTTVRKASRWSNFEDVFHDNDNDNEIPFIGFDMQLLEDGAVSVNASLFKSTDGWRNEQKILSLDGDERIKDNQESYENLFKHIMSANAPLMTMRTMRDDGLRSLLDRRLT